MVGLDLVRAIAISGVLAAHVGGLTLHAFGVGGRPFRVLLLGGHGVELFFALSGFLIGRLLFEIVEREPSPRSWGIFLVRRWLRTVPLYAGWLAVLLMIAPPADPLGSALTYAAFLQNLAWPMPADQWFGISWSLTVEEWFYVVFSGLLLAVARWGTFGLAVVCVAFLVVPLVARVAWFSGTGDWDAEIRKVVVFRLDAIAYGVAVAALCRYRPRATARWRTPLFVAGVLLFVGIGLPTTRDLLGTLWVPLSFSVIGIGCASMLPIALTVDVPSAAARSAIRWLSERSYGLYLVHLTVLDLVWAHVARGDMPRAWLAPAILGGSAVLAELSFRYLETPILRRRPRQFPAASLVAGGE